MARSASTAVVAVLLLVGPARAGDVDTLAVSREGTLYVPPNALGTLAVSRETTLYLAPNAVTTLAVSRESSLYIPAGLVATRAVSREASIFVYYTLANATTALRIAAGLHTADPVQQSRLNPVTPGNEIDLLDAMRVAWLATHPGSSP